MTAEGKSEDVAKRISYDVTKFFNNVPHSSGARYSDVKLNTSNLLEYAEHLKQERNVAPSTIQDKLRNLCLVIEYLLTQENSTMEDNKLNSKCLRWLEKRAKILRKGICIAKDAADFKSNARRTRGGDGG